MSRRSLLSVEQRARLFGVPTAPAEMAMHYVLSLEDLVLVRTKRRSMNRLGFAVQLCLLRHPGQGLGPGQQPPAALLDFVAGQLGVPAAAFADYARRDQTRREHAAELLAILGLRSFRLRDWRDCLRVGADAAWATNRGEPIVQAMLTHLRAQGVLVPDAAVLERIGLTARARARQRTFQVLADGITEAERILLDGLLVTDRVSAARVLLGCVTPRRHPHRPTWWRCSTGWTGCATLGLPGTEPHGSIPTGSRAWWRRAAS